MAKDQKKFGKKLSNSLGIPLLLTCCAGWIGWLIWVFNKLLTKKETDPSMLQEVIKSPIVLSSGVLLIIITIIIVPLAWRHRPFRESLKKSIFLIYRDISLLFFGHRKIYKNVETINNKLETFLMTSFAARFFRFDKLKRENKNLYIFFSYFPGSVLHDVANYQKSRLIAPFNKEEANFIMKTWFQASSHLDWKNVHVNSSADVEKRDGVGISVNEINPLLKENLVIIGSSKFNRLTEFMLNRGKWIKYYFKALNDKSICYDSLVCLAYNIGTNNIEKFNPTFNQQVGDQNIDYALITRMPNPLAPENYVFIFGGCRYAGHLAVENYFFHPDVLEALSKVSSQKEILEIVLKVDYKWGNPIPQLEEIEVVSPTDLSLPSPLIIA